MPDAKPPRGDPKAKAAAGALLLFGLGGAVLLLRGSGERAPRAPFSVQASMPDSEKPQLPPVPTDSLFSPPPKTAPSYADFMAALRGRAKKHPDAKGAVDMFAKEFQKDPELREVVKMFDEDEKKGVTRTADEFVDALDAKPAFHSFLEKLGGSPEGAALYEVMTREPIIADAARRITQRAATGRETSSTAKAGRKAGGTTMLLAAVGPAGREGEPSQGAGTGARTQSASGSGEGAAATQAGAAGSAGGPSAQTPSSGMGAGAQEHGVMPGLANTGTAGATPEIERFYIQEGDPNVPHGYYFRAKDADRTEGDVCKSYGSCANAAPYCNRRSRVPWAGPLEFGDSWTPGPQGDGCCFTYRLRACKGEQCSGYRIVSACFGVTPP
ncbi:MAG: hypothetical protein HY925_00320 [Elusimicrobia bacterium]|nr:hypothetical protein [Elusimicrobiota bacterium]